MKEWMRIKEEARGEGEMLSIDPESTGAANRSKPSFRGV